MSEKSLQGLDIAWPSSAWSSVPGGCSSDCSTGICTSAYGSYVPWGLWVAFDLFFLGLTAGAFLITILTYVFRLKLFAPSGR